MAKTRDLSLLFSQEELLELDEQFDECEHGRRLRCDSCASRDWDKGRKDGFENGFNWVIAELRRSSAAAFMGKADSEAHHLRGIADEITKLAVKEKLISNEKKR